MVRAGTLCAQNNTQVGHAREAVRTPENTIGENKMTQTMRAAAAAAAPPPPPPPPTRLTPRNALVAGKRTTDARGPGGGGADLLAVEITAMPPRVMRACFCCHPGSLAEDGSLAPVGGRRRGCSAQCNMSSGLGRMAAYLPQVGWVMGGTVGWRRGKPISDIRTRRGVAHTSGQRTSSCSFFFLQFFVFYV